MEMFEFRKRRLSLIKPFIYWRKQEQEQQLSEFRYNFTRGEGGGDSSSNNSNGTTPTKSQSGAGERSDTLPSSGRDSSLSLTTPTQNHLRASSATDLSTPSLSNTTTTTPQKTTKVERRASGASKFLRSLRPSHSKDSKEAINFIALKELDSDNHCLSPEGKRNNPGYNSTAFRPNNKPLLLSHTPPTSSSSSEQGGISRSQSFQEKRLLVSTSKSTVFLPPPNNSSSSAKVIAHPLPIKVKHSRAQSFVCNTSSPFLLRQQQLQQHQNYQNLLHLQQQQQQQLHTQNIYSVPKPSSSSSSPPQNVNGLPAIPPPTTSPPPQPPLPKCETIYENLEVILEQGKAKRRAPIMAIDVGRNGRKLVADTSKNKNYADYANIDMMITENEKGVTTTNSATPVTTGPENMSTPLNINGHAGVGVGVGEADFQNGMSGRKLRRSISEVPSDRVMLPFPKKILETSQRALYSSIGNGLSIWKLDKSRYNNHPPPCNSQLKGKCGSTQALYSTPHRPAYPVYSTLPRNHSTQGICSSPKPPQQVPPLSLHQRYSPSSSGNVSLLSSSNTTPLPALSPARSTPNLGSSAKLQLTPQQTPPNHPIYREPPTYTPGPVVNSFSLGRNNRQFPTGLRSSRSSENVKLLQDYSIITKETIPTNSATTATPSGASDHVPVTMSSSLGGNSPSWLKDKSSTNSAPVRDSSSLKAIRYGPGHEKYPSWPIPASSVAEVDPVGSASPGSSAKNDLTQSGSVRSKSWTESTDYPKEKVPSYARPYMKKMMMTAASNSNSNSNSTSAYSNQLKTVLEKCEKAKQGGGRGGYLLQPPHGYRDHQHHQHPPEKEYNIPSPPERESAVKPLTQEDVENYSKKYEELLSQYAGSEGYHSYISSECSSSSYVSSSSTTPFLDLLRRESGDLLNHHHQPFYDHLDPSDPLFALAHLAANRSGRESVTTVVTNSSGSSSGTETLKCFGSASDVSIASSSNNRWDSHKNPSKHSSSKAPNSPTKSWSPPTSDMSSREINLKKFPLSTYTRPSTLSLEKQQQQAQQEKDFSPTSSVVTTPTTPPFKQPSSNSPIIDTSKPPSVAERIWELEQKQSKEKAASLPPQPHPPTISTSSSFSSTNNSSNSSLPLKSVAQLGTGGLSHSTETLPLTSSLIQSIKEQAGEAKAAAAAAAQQTITPLSTTATTNGSTYKNLWNGSEKDIPTTTTSSTTTEVKQPVAVSVGSSTVVGDSGISYSYLDPEKKHKVADMTLKAIQKKALLSYYERHAGKGESSGTSHNKGAIDANQGENKPEHNDDSVIRADANDRLGIMSKYTSNNNNGQLAGRDGVGNGWKSTSGSTGGAQICNAANNAANNATSLTSSSSSEPTPPERPPKKPHLRQFHPHQVDNDLMSKDSSPPPPLPRAPIRPPAPAPPPITANLVSGVPPVPSKPAVGVPVNVGIVTMARSPSPDLPLPPPPPPIAEEEEVEVLDNDEPLPPPPSLIEVSNCLGSRSRSVSGLSSYLHKDSYLAQRKERTLGYEGRYRRITDFDAEQELERRMAKSFLIQGELERTLSPSGMGSNNNNSHKSENGNGGVVSTAPRNMTSTSHVTTTTTMTTTTTGKLDTSLTPSGWEKYHNIRPPSTTVIFSSHELPKPVSPTTGFTRSVSCDSNLFNNKTGFTQSTIPPPVAQVAPLRDPYYHPHHYHYAQSQSSLLELEKVVAVEPFRHESSSSSSSASSSSSLTFLPGSDLHLHNGNYQMQDQHPPSLPPPINNNKSNTVMVSPLQHNNNHKSQNHHQNHKKMVDLDDETSLKKSEVSLRVNCTSDVGSQTEKEKKNANGVGNGASPTQVLSSPSRSVSSSSSSSSGGSSCSSSFDDSSGSSSSSSKGHSLKGNNPFSVIPSYTGRQKSQEELECEELSRSLIKKLPQGDKLQKILVPLPEHKTTADYMEGLFQLELKLKPEKEEKETNTSPRSSPDLLQSLPKGDGGKNPSKTPSPTLITQKEDKPKNIFGGSKGGADDGSQDSNKRCNGHAPLPADSAYFTTSECKAKFLTQYVNDMNSKSSSCKSQDSQELNQQKEMLVSRISRKLEILRTEQLEIREEIESNEELGHQVVDRVKGSAKRNEFDKFKLHVEEIEKITSLLLGLSGRLARAENALMSLAENNPNPQEKKILESKRDKLREQLDEAKVLKENIDRRSVQVSTFLQKYLTVEDYADYHHFVKMKAKLIIDAREIDDKIKLGEEQMIALKDTLSSSIPASS